MPNVHPQSEESEDLHNLTHTTHALNTTHTDRITALSRSTQTARTTLHTAYAHNGALERFNMGDHRTRNLHIIRHTARMPASLVARCGRRSSLRFRLAMRAVRWKPLQNTIQDGRLAEKPGDRPGDELCEQRDVDARAPHDRLRFALGVDGDDIVSRQVGGLQGNVREEPRRKGGERVVVNDVTVAERGRDNVHVRVGDEHDKKRVDYVCRQ